MDIRGVPVSKTHSEGTVPANPIEKQQVFSFSSGKGSGKVLFGETRKKKRLRTIPSKRPYLPYISGRATSMPSGKSGKGREPLYPPPAGEFIWPSQKKRDQRLKGRTSGGRSSTNKSASASLDHRKAGLDGGGNDVKKTLHHSRVL